MRTSLQVFLLAFLSVCLLQTGFVNASHMVGVDLTYFCTGGNNYNFRVTIYRDCAGIDVGTSQTIDISSVSCGFTSTISLTQQGAGVEVSQLCPDPSVISTCNGGAEPGIEQYVFTGSFTLPQNCPDWIFSWSECCRNDLITNLTSPSSEDMYVKATLNNSSGICNNSPFFTTLSAPYICPGIPFTYNHGAVDMDGDSLVYSLVNPLTGPDPGFPIGYTGGYSPTYPITTTTGAVSFDSVTGQLSFTPNATQVSVVTVLVEEYRNGVKIGSTMRDIQVIVIQDPLQVCNSLPELQFPVFALTGGTLSDSNKIDVCVGSTLSFKVNATDVDSANIIIMTSNIKIVIPKAIFSATGTNPVTGTFRWTPEVKDIGNKTFTITVEDNGCPITGSQTYAFILQVIPSTYAGPDVFLCEGDTTQLTVGGGTEFTWTPSAYLSSDTILNPLAFPPVTTTYIVTSNLIGICRNEDSIVVNVVPNYTVTTDTIPPICLGGSVQLGVTASPANTYIYKWNPNTGLNNDSIPNPIASPESTTTYTVTVSSPAGCAKEANLTVTVNPVPLSVNPTADKKVICKGSSTILRSNVSAGNCNEYIINAISFNPIGGSGTSVSLGDDATSSALNIGFDFVFFCNFFDQFYISSNGYITFGSGSSSFSPQNIPSTSTPNNLIAFAWSDLNPAMAGTNINYFTTGTAPNRKLVINFENVQHSPSGNPVTAQIILYETSNIIEIYTTAMPSTGTDHTQGIENGGGTIGYAVAGRNAANWFAVKDAYRFIPTTPPPFTIKWTDPLGTILGNTVDITVSPLVTTTYTVDVTDGVCKDTKTVNVEVSSVSVSPDTSICTGDSAMIRAIYYGPVGLNSPTNCGVSTGCLGTGGIVDYSAGTGTSSNSSTGYPAPYGNWYKNAKHQFLYRASELTAAGLTAGTINKIAFDIAVVTGTNTYNGFQIRMGCTSATSVTTWQSGLQTVFNPKIVTIATGWKVHTLDTPYNWDGISNLIIEVCYDNTALPYTNNSSTYYTVTGYSSVIYYNSDVTVACTYTGTQTTSSNRPNTKFTLCTESFAPQYSWSPSTEISDTASANPKASPDSITTYVLTFNNGLCTFTDSVKITPVDIFPVVSVTNESCGGLCDGSITVMSSAGVSPFTYIWNDPLSQNSAMASNLCAGNYSVTVSDANGCMDSVSATVLNGGNVSITQGAINDASCFGMCDGSATIIATGGIPPLTYLWDDPASQSNSTSTGLCVGSFKVTVTDSGNCMKTDTVIISQPTAIVTQTNITCPGVCDGSATVTPVGGFSPYTYKWDDPLSQTDSTATGLCVGIFRVTVTDAAGCVIYDSANTTGPTLAITQNGCMDNCNGTATATPSGGATPYSYLWNDQLSQVTPEAVGLCSGTYNVTVFDAAGCVMKDTVIIPSKLILIMADSVPVSCVDSCNGKAIVTQNGGSAPYTYTWNGGTSQTDSVGTGLCKGINTVNVIDAKGCISNSTVTIKEPSAIIAVTDATCYGICDGQATVAPTGGTPSYTYLWDDAGSQNTDTAFNLCAGTYTVTVTDANNCILITSAIIKRPTSQASKTDATCNGICDGAAKVAPIDGVGPYSYLWDDPASQTAQVASGLCVGITHVTITDINSCLIIDSVTISEASPLVYNKFVIKNVSCTGGCDGEAKVIPSEGTPPYTYLWDAPLSMTTATVTGLCAKWYKFKITDANGCFKNDSVIITEPLPMNVIISDKTNLKCYNVCDGKISVSAGGGTLPYYFSWNNGMNDSVVSNLCAGDYTVSVKDAGLCQQILTTTLTQPPQLTAITSPTKIKCYYSCDGQITATPSGGVPPYTYSWSDNQNTKDAIELCLGSYMLSLSDSFDCKFYIKDSINAIPMPPMITDFLIDPDTTTVLNPEIKFTNLSAGSDSWEWDFGDGSYFSGLDTTHSYSDKQLSTYIVVLHAFNSLGCVDSSIKSVTVKDGYTLFVPTAFTPNNDGDNDTFYPKFLGLDLNKSKLYIFNRWGEIIFQTDDLNQSWNGAYNNGNKISPVGIYVWLIIASELNGTPHRLVGRVALIR